MLIKIHQLYTVIHGFGQQDLPTMHEILGIPPLLYADSSYGNYITLKYAFDFSKHSESAESVYFRLNKETGYAVLNLHGSFFDCSPKFSIEALFTYLSRFRHTIKQVDIAFDDDAKCLSFKNIRRWLREPDKYCTGSLVSRSIPTKLVQKDRITAFRLGAATSPTNYATIYRRPDTRFIRVELKIKKKEKIDYILESYDIDNLDLFHERCLVTLIGCINFITPTSKRTRKPSMYKRQTYWAKFLRSDVPKPNWRRILSERHKNREISDNKTAEKKIRRGTTSVVNMISILTAIMSEKEILRQMFAGTKYRLIKRK